jgi:SAM-dependent methyltransferase
MTIEEQLERMRRDWDARARKNARHYVATGRTDWTDEAFLASGDEEVAGDILSDMQNICQGKDPREMRILEIGCGAGRVTRALAKVFGEVYAVDISAEMIAEAAKVLADVPNVHLYRNNGMDLAVLPPVEFDFAYSVIVFQHIPSREIIENYVREVHKRLRAGALFKFWVMGDPQARSTPEETWVGVPITEADAFEMAERCGFEQRYAHRADAQSLILWFFKKPSDR